jgi:hypothetical protein
MVPLKELLEKFVITPKLLYTETTQNVLVDLKKTPKKTKHITNSLENDMQILLQMTPANEGLIRNIW